MTLYTSARPVATAAFPCLVQLPVVDESFSPPLPSGITVDDQEFGELNEIVVVVLVDRPL